jgi:predicted deacylase
MHRIDHPLLSPSLGSQKTLTSLHFGPSGTGQKVYIQASLHAEELPGMLVAHHLRQHLADAEDKGLLRGEVVLVPVANPLGLAQRLDHKPMGRFELGSSENFNRNYPDFAKALWPTVLPQLGADAAHNVRTVRRAMGDYLQAWTPSTELESLRKTLLTLAHDADTVIDLHCDCEAVLHMYCEESCWPQLRPLAQFTQCETILLAKESGGEPFDECLSGVWWRLQQTLQAQGFNHPLPQGCCSTTLELRGEADVTHALAQTDAQALLHYLQHTGILHTQNPPQPPTLRCQATPLAGSQTLRASAPGIVVFCADIGQTLQIGDLVAEIIDPLQAQTQRILAEVSGCFYARIRDRYVTSGCELGKIASATAFKTGPLLGN